jgi:A/G-specific adenine glycosylase
MPNPAKLLNWYTKNHRNLPWRSTSDPYKIWLSEIILQQTRVDQGMKYYLDFTETYPRIRDLAQASEDEVLKLWQGLGYYSRARNLHHTAKTVTNEHGGIFPSTYPEILSLKGIGPYTAAAIASIVFNIAKPVIDGNVLRVISRWYAIEEPVDKTSTKKKIEEVLDNLIDKKNPGMFNQAMMEFGALYCKPKNPDCLRCIFKDQCLAFQKDRVADLPRKTMKTKISKRFFNYLVFRFSVKDEKHTLLYKRNKNDIWKGLYEFPLIESPTEVLPEELMRSKDWAKMIDGSDYVLKSISKSYLHQLSHQRIQARFISIDIQNPRLSNFSDYLSLPIKDLHNYPIPRLIDKFVDEYGI